MCGICGIYSFTGEVNSSQHLITKAIKTLEKRGPEVQAHYISGPATLGHSRLSIIDTSEAANQPFTDESGVYTIIFNGEIYNFRQLRKSLESKGINFKTQSDTEVLLKWIIDKGSEGIEDLHGFFSFALYNKIDQSLLLARDRFGIKPFLYFIDDERLLFASEMKAMIALGIPKDIDYTSLQAYFQLNYIPAPWSIYRNVLKLMPGHYMEIVGKKVKLTRYYGIPFPQTGKILTISYEEAQKVLKQKLEEAVVKRLVSDVPLGAFLSGGIDSSIIVALASKHIDKLNTFSIGFRDEPMFDETKYANSVAKMHKTDHTVFSLTTTDLLDCLYDVLDYTDEPFADSSALAVYILSRETKSKVTVALSGDGADEMFAGYNKHMAEWNVANAGIPAKMLKYLHPLLSIIPQSRNSYVPNKVRQLRRFGKGMSMSPQERYWSWATFTDENYPFELLLNNPGRDHFLERKKTWTQHIGDSGDINQLLYNDMHLVLPNDMLTKVDLMSMANSLEVRVPFLDHDVVNFAFGLPQEYKIDKSMRKKILKDAFRNDLPAELYNRPKQGFEVPLLKWFRSELKDNILNNWMNDEFIRSQKIFNPEVINNLKKKLFSVNPGEIHAQIWSIVVFQHWYKKINC
jgi:asparagine synthase (glutamine-hydrolysing)